MKRLLIFLLLVSPAFAQTVPQANWALVYADSANAGYPATNAFDGNKSTFWHTQFSPTTTPQPHEIQIDLGATYNLTGFSYLPRQDGQINGNVEQYVFYVSTDLTQAWTNVASGTWGCCGGQQTVTFSQAVARYIRFQSLAAAGSGWTNVAELNVTGTAAGPPPSISTFQFPLQLTTCTKCDGSDDAGAGALGILGSGASVSITSGSSAVCSGALNANAQMLCSGGINTAPALIPLSVTITSSDGSQSYTVSQQVLGILFSGRGTINIIGLFDATSLQPRGLRIYTQ